MDEGGKNIADRTGETVSEPVRNIPEELQKRRSTRAVQAVPLMVSGVDALGRSFTERTSTLIINCHGCRYQSKHYVLKNMWVTLEIPHSGSGQPPRVVRGRVAWIQRPRSVRQLFQVALELEIPGNVWGIAFPPGDWFSSPDTAQLPAGVAPSAQNPPPEATAQEHVRPAGEAEMDFPIPLSGADVAETSEPDNVRVFPAPLSTADAAAQLTRQVTRLVEDAQQQVQASVQQAAAQAVSAERRMAIEDFEQRFAIAREELSHELSGAIEKIQQESESSSRAAHEAARETMRNDLTARLGHQLEELTRGITVQISQEISAQRGEQARRLQDAVQGLERALRQAEETTARLAESVKQSETQVAGRTAAAIGQAEEAVRQQEEALAAQRELLRISASEIQQHTASALASAQAVWQKHLSGELEAAQMRWQIAIDNAVAGAQATATGSLREQSSEQLAQLREESGRLLAELRKTAATVTSETQRQLTALEQSIQLQSEQLQTALARATEKLQQLESSASRMETLQQGAVDLQSQIGELLNRHIAELQRRSDSLFEEVSARIRGAFEESAREAVARFGQQIESAVKPHVASAEEAVHRLAGGRSLLEAALTMQQDRIRKSAEEAFAEALEQFRTNLGSAEQLLKASTGTVAARSLAEFEEKVAGVKRQATEDLLKSAEWYEKKAQTQIHSLTEKTCEQAEMKLREKAAEVSSIFGTELDHSSRTFIDHTQTQMEEVVRDAFERSRALFSEAADTTSAAFIDEIQRGAREELSGFETEIQKSATESRSELEAAQSEITQKLTSEQEDFLRRFEASMRGVLEAGIAEAHGRVQAGFEPLLQSWKSMTDAHQAEMRGLYTRMGEQAAEEYRGRLENVSKQWMLATVASLDRQSREVLSGASSAAAGKMREAFTAVFAEMGEALRERLRQIGANVELPVPQKSP